MKIVGNGNELRLNGATVCAAVQDWLDRQAIGNSNLKVQRIIKIASCDLYCFELEPVPAVKVAK